MNTQKTYSKKELLAMMPSKKNLDSAINTTHCAGDISYSERDIFEAGNNMIERCADALADKLQKSEALSVEETKKLFCDVEYIMNAILSSASILPHCSISINSERIDGDEHLNRAFQKCKAIRRNIHAAMKKETT